jgi:serine/threonine protein kinase
VQTSELGPIEFSNQIKQMHLYSVSGIEFLDDDTLDILRSGDHLFYSFSTKKDITNFQIDEGFDYQVCMENYEMGKKLGEGGFGQVYLATDKSSGKKVAIKLLSVLDHPLSPHMMNKEIEALAKLKHRHIVKLYRWFPFPKKHQIVLVMEYLEGGELYQYWQGKEGKHVNEQEAKEIMLQLLQAIEHCHENKIIHRDLKFQNIILAHKPQV